MTGSDNTLYSAPENSNGPFLRRMRIRNYKSIGKCEVDLARVNVLVGRNGSGKSNFLDALSFVVDSLQTSLDHAVKSRGGIDAVRRRSTGHPRNFAIELQLDLPNFRTVTYGFEIAARGQGKFIVKYEVLRISDLSNSDKAYYEVRDGKLCGSSAKVTPPVMPDRLSLVTMSNLPEFRTVYDALFSMGFYNLNPDIMKKLQSPDAGELLHRDGSNIAGVIGRIREARPLQFDRIKAYLAVIVPGITEVNRISLGPSETLEFKQQVKGAKAPWTFYANNMSDGTLRALGALVAVTQVADRKLPVCLVGIEEPETALHPAAAGALVDALREAAEHTQIIITCHSPDLLDRFDPETESLLVVTAREGNTQIATIDPASKNAIKTHLYSPGELLRMDQLEPDVRELKRQQQMKLFDTDEDDE